MPPRCHPKRVRGTLSEAEGDQARVEGSRCCLFRNSRLREFYPESVPLTSITRFSSPPPLPPFLRVSSGAPRESNTCASSPARSGVPGPAKMPPRCHPERVRGTLSEAEGDQARVEGSRCCLFRNCRFREFYPESVPDTSDHRITQSPNHPITRFSSPPPLPPFLRVSKVLGLPLAGSQQLIANSSPWSPSICANLWQIFSAFPRLRGEIKR